MPTLPSIKGTVFAAVVEDVKQALQAGKVKQAGLSPRGAANAKRLLAGGLYQQLEYLKRASSDGFVNEMARAHNTLDLWLWERPEPDRIVFRMTREL
jgi:hypothetical protein